MKAFNLHRAIATILLVSTGVLVEIPASSTAAYGQSRQGDVGTMLDEKRVALQDISGSATEAINVLRHKYGVPVSFISIPNEKPQTVQFRDEELTLRQALDEFVQTRPKYAHSLVGDHLMVYPRSGPFKQVIAGIDIRNKPRLDAIGTFVEHLQRTHPEFGNLLPGGFLGNPEAPLYAEPVSALKGEATVLEHITVLLGDNPNVIFSILDGPRPDTRSFVLDQVKSGEAKPAAKPKDRRTTEPQ